MLEHRPPHPCRPLLAHPLALPPGQPGPATEHRPRPRGMSFELRILCMPPLYEPTSLYPASRLLVSPAGAHLSRARSLNIVLTVPPALPLPPVLRPPTARPPQFAPRSPTDRRAPPPGFAVRTRGPVQGQHILLLLILRLRLLHRRLLAERRRAVRVSAVVPRGPRQEGAPRHAVLRCP